MSIFFEVNHITDPKISAEIENVFRAFLADRPKDEDWKVWIRSMGGPCEITLKGHNQTRERLFFDESSRLPGRIREWLELYPFK